MEVNLSELSAIANNLTSQAENIPINTDEITNRITGAYNQYCYVYNLIEEKYNDAVRCKEANLSSREWISSKMQQIISEMRDCTDEDRRKSLESQYNNLQNDYRNISEELGRLENKSIIIQGCYERLSYYANACYEAESVITEANSKKEEIADAFNRLSSTFSSFCEKMRGNV